MKVIQQRMPPRAARYPTRSGGAAWEVCSAGGEGSSTRSRWWGVGRAGGIAAVEGTAEGGGEKEVARPVEGMTYLRNQVYVGRRNIVREYANVSFPVFVPSVIVYFYVFSIKVLS